MNSRRSWLVFAVGAVVYMTAVMQRTTLGVAGVDAADRFHSSAALLSTLAVVQLVVYAGLQIPVGILIDRIGPSWLIIAGCVLMIAGQLILSIAPDIPAAILGRVFVGAGDAAVFISVIRLVNSWFSGPIVPQLSQWIGNIGQLGQVLSALPFALVLHTLGWTPAFSVAAAVAFVALVLAVVLLRDRPADALGQARASTLTEALKLLGPTLKRPGTQLGFWSHFVSQSSGTVFTIFWGFPFLVEGVGLERSVASGLLVVIVASGIVAGPILGLLSARYPMRRSNLVLGITSALGLVWAAVLLWPGVPPIWLIVILLVTLGVGGPGSLIGFDFARSFNPSRSLGSANGVVNVGGFMASFVMLFLVGLILDLQYESHLTSSLYSMDAFRLAFAVQYVIIGTGVVFLLRARRRTRRRLQEDEGISVAPLWVALVGKWSTGRR